MVHDAPPWRDHSPFPDAPDVVCPACKAPLHAPPNTLVLAADALRRTADDLAPVLLVMLVEQTGRDTCAPITLVNGKGGHPALEAIGMLLDGGYIKAASTPGATAFQLTAAGLRHADEIVRQRANHGIRRDFALDELVAAAFAEPDEQVHIQDFTAFTFHLGERLDVSTVIAAAHDLVSYGLAVPIPPDGERPEQLALTRAGRHCAALKMKVVQYVTQHSPGNGPVFNQYVQPGGAGAQGVHITQTNGLRPGDFAPLLEQLRGATPRVGAARDLYLADLATLQDPHAPGETRRSALVRVRFLLEQAGAASGIIQAAIAIAALI
ncbi:hypothetical protein [Streptomyces sp. NPDC058674]|uniref:hypothetical protein n=1 Tax=Streptomyces sp. NPDC058674 TaxID=3346592 RepID=UPI003662D98B